MKLRNLAALIALFSLATLGSAFAEADIKITDAWVRSAPPTLKVHGAYFTLHNSGTTDIEITSIESPAYEFGELHISKVENGVAVMQKLVNIKVKSGKMLKLEPGGLHTMLINPKKPLGLGDKIPLILKLANGKTFSFEAEVKSGKKMMQDHRGSHH